MYAFAATQERKMELTKDGQLLFADPIAQERVKSLLMKIASQEVLLTAALTNADKLSQRIEVDDERMRKEAEAIISK